MATTTCFVKITENEPLSPLSFHKICRICLEETELVSMHSEYKDGLTISQIFEHTTSLKVVNDSMPKNICKSCFGVLTIAHFFIETCKSVDQRLKEAIKNECTLNSNIFSKLETTRNFPNDDNNFLFQDDMLYADIPETIFFEQDLLNNNLLLENELKLPKYSNNDVATPSFAEGKDSNVENNDENTAQNVTKWPCDQCGKVFNLQFKLKIHMKSHETKKEYSCDECGEKFRFSSNLSRHKKLHNGKSHVCNICGKAFPVLSVLKEHQRVHTGEAPYECSFCEKKFQTKIKHKNHLRMHHIKNIADIKDEDILADIYRFQCHICNKLLSAKRSLTHHLLMHVDKRFSCEECNRAFISEESLNNHKKTHTGIKVYNCKYCEKSFYYKTTLKDHVRIHEGVKPFKCSECDKSFVQQQQLKYHLRKHSGERPFVCQHCGKSFTFNGNLVVHLRTHIIQAEKNEKLEIAA